MLSRLSFPRRSDPLVKQQDDEDELHPLDWSANGSRRGFFLSKKKSPLSSFSTHSHHKRKGFAHFASMPLSLASSSSRGQRSRLSSNDGSEIFSAASFHDGDDDDSSASSFSEETPTGPKPKAKEELPAAEWFSSPTTPSSSTTWNKAEAIAMVEQAVEDQENKRQQTDKLIERAYIFLEARLKANNHVGSVLSMKQVLRYEAAKTNYTRAVAELELLLIDDLAGGDVPTRSACRKRIKGIVQEVPIPALDTLLNESNEAILQEAQRRLETRSIRAKAA